MAQCASLSPPPLPLHLLDPPQAPNLGDAADIERLNKMFGMGDADK